MFHSDQRMPLLHVTRMIFYFPIFSLSLSINVTNADQFKENVKIVEKSCNLSCFHPILPVLAFTHNCGEQIVKFLTANCVSTPFSEWKDSKMVFQKNRGCHVKIRVLTWNVSQVKVKKSCLVRLVIQNNPKFGQTYLLFS